MSDREGYDGHFAEKFLKKVSIPSLSYGGDCIAIWLSLLGNS